MSARNEREKNYSIYDTVDVKVTRSSNSRVHTTAESTPPVRVSSVDDQLFDRPVLVRSVGQISSNLDRNFLVPKLLHSDLQRVRFVFDIYHDWRVHAGTQTSENQITATGAGKFIDTVRMTPKEPARRSKSEDSTSCAFGATSDVNRGKLRCGAGVRHKFRQQLCFVRHIYHRVRLHYGKVSKRRQLNTCTTP